MNLDNLIVYLPFIVSLLTLFAAPVFSRFLNKGEAHLKENLGKTDMIENYTSALESAWDRIEFLEKENRQLSFDNRKLSNEIYDLKENIEFLTEHGKE